MRGNKMKKIKHSDFLIVKYIKFLEKRGIPPLLSSMFFGGIFIIFIVFFYIFYGITPTFGYLSCVSWLLIGPYLIYKAGEFIDDLWPKMTEILNQNDISRLQSYEKTFYSCKYLILGFPAATAVSIIILLPVLFPGIAPVPPTCYLIFYLISWIILAILGSIGVWGIFQLIRLINAIGKCDLNLSPLSHDKFGGMEFLADFGIKATLMYSSGALMIPMVIDLATRGEAPKQVVLISMFGSGVFAFTVLLSFLVQIFALHKAAVRGREKLIRKSSKQYRKLLQKYEQEPNVELGIRLLVMQGFFDEAYRIKVYPWDLGIVLKLATSVSLPIILGLIKVWFPWLPIS